MKAHEECWQCKYRKAIPGNTHIECLNPSDSVKGNPHGIKNHWFNYPYSFDPVWKETKCSNFEKVQD